MKKMSKEDEEELERLYQKWKDDPADDVWGYFRQHFAELEAKQQNENTPPKTDQS